LFSEKVQVLATDESTAATLVYIRGNIVRKILNRSSCQKCTNNLISNVKESNSSSFVVQMDFSGNSLLEPNEKIMIFFHLLLSVYVHHKEFIKTLSLSQNVLKSLCTSSLDFLTQNHYSLPFCKEHIQYFTKIMVETTMKTFLKAYIHEMNEKNPSKSISELNKNRKLCIFTSI
jgi:hypothetical protein